MLKVLIVCKSPSFGLHNTSEVFHHIGAAAFYLNACKSKQSGEPADYVAPADYVHNYMTTFQEEHN